MIVIILFVIFTIMFVMALPIFMLMATVVEYEKLRKLGFEPDVAPAPLRPVVAETQRARAA